MGTGDGYGWGKKPVGQNGCEEESFFVWSIVCGGTPRVPCNFFAILFIFIFCFFFPLPAFYFAGKRKGLIHVRHQTMPASCPPPHAATINKTRDAALPEGGSGVGAHVRHPHTAAATKTPGQAAEYLSACVRYRPRLPLATYASSSPFLNWSMAPSPQHFLVHKNRGLA